MIELDDITGPDSSRRDRERRENRKARFREIRDELGMSVDEISVRVDCATSSWYRWESEGVLPRSMWLHRIHRLTGHDLSWLRGE